MNTWPPALPHNPARSTRPLWVSGVRWGVGTRTLCRLLAANVDARARLHASSQLADVLVVSPHSDATALAASQLQAYPPGARPWLVVMHTVPGRLPANSRARLRAAAPYVRGVIDVPYVPAWVGMDVPPGDPASWPKAVRSARAELLRSLGITPSPSVSGQMSVSAAAVRA